MSTRPPNLPRLLVEGADDVSTIAALLKRHGYDTKRGLQHLYIEWRGSVDELLEAMPDTIKAERNAPCGFVLDIDVQTSNRWKAVTDRLKFTGDPMTQLSTAVDPDCPANGYIGQVDGYRYPFGVWLMPDCTSDYQKLENLIATLIPDNHPLKSFAEKCTDEAAQIIDDANANHTLPTGAKPWDCFREVDTIKAQLRTWLAWQREPGMAFGTALNNKVLSHDSPQALAFLDWLSRLYGFTFT